MAEKKQYATLDSCDKSYGLGRGTRITHFLVPYLLASANLLFHFFPPLYTLRIKTYHMST